MVDFFSGQLDYVLFVYGLAFVFLGVVCFAIRQPQQKFLPWHYIGFFGLLHGIHEWLQLWTFSAGDNPLLAAFRLTLLIASLALLVEFGRVSIGRLGRRTPRRWILLPLLFFLLVAALVGGEAGLDGGARYAFGLVGSLWAAAALILRSRAVAEPAARWLRLSGFLLVLYGAAAGLVVPASSLLLAPWLNNDSFFTATGLPIQVLRAILASGFAAAVWAYEQQRFAVTPLKEKRKGYFQFSTAALLLVLVFGWVLTERLGNLYRAELQHQVDAELSLIAERLAGTMAVTRGLSRTMSGSPAIAGLPLTPSPRLERLVDRYARAAPGLLAYVLDLHGNVVANSNRGTTVALTGHSYAYRPYFKAALQGNEGGHFALGAVTGLPGFYASAPIRGANGALTGVAVIKKGLDPEELGLHHFENGFLVDEDGVVLLSSRSAGPIRIWPSAGEAASQNGPRAALSPRRLNHGDRVRLNGNAFLVGIRSVPGDSWSIVVLERETISLVSRLFGIALTLLISVLILLASFGLQREIGTEIQLHENQARLQELSERLERQAMTDTLTGAFNRLKFDEVLAAEMARAARYGTPLSVIMYDIDLFKRINDRYGHHAGDLVLVELTRLMAANIRASDTLARWGGEEFMIIVPQATLVEATALAQKLRHLVQATPLGPERITCSFGVAELRERQSMEAFTGRADHALYEAKTLGRNRVEAA